MKKSLVALAALAAACLPLISSATPLDPRQVSAEAAWVAHLDADKLWASNFGQSLQAELVVPQVKAKLDLIAGLLGMDVRKDIHGLTLYGPVVGKKQGVAVLNGSFDSQKTLAILQTTPGYSSATYGNHTIHHWIEAKKAQEPNGGERWGAFFNEDTIVISEQESLVKSALEVLDGTKPALKQGGLVGSYEANSGDNVLFAVADTTQAAALAGNTADGRPAKPQAKMLQNAKGICFTLREQGPNTLFSLKLAGKDPKATAAIEQAFRGIQALGVLAQDSNPQMAKYAEALKISSAGADVTAQLPINSEELFQACKAKVGQKKTRPAPAPAAMVRRGKMAPPMEE